jgi:hypothetical protein
MTTLPTGEGLASSSQVKSDELTVIHGISPERAAKFRECGIDSLQELADISDAKAESVATQIKYVSAQMIKDWRARAQERLSPPQVEEDASPEAETDVEEAEWRSIASFSVAFQSRKVGEQREQRRVQIAHRQGDGPRFFDDVESDRPWQWILDQLSQRAQPQEEPQEELAVLARPAAKSSAPELLVQPEITQIRLFQPRYTETPIEASKTDELFPGAIDADEPFAVEASFTLTGPGASEAAQRQSTYRASFSARSLPPGRSVDLGDMWSRPSMQAERPYRVRLPKASLPAGIYRLQVTIAVQGAGIAVSNSDGPILQVV